VITHLMLLFVAGCSGLAYHAAKDADRLLARYDICELYAVDSWFRANGENAVVVSLAKWRDGYDPGRAR